MFFHYIAEKNQSENDWPAKCVYWLLQRSFYGVDNIESIDNTAKTFTSKISASYNAMAQHTSKLSKIDAKNQASLKALQHLCEIENKLVRQIWDDKFPSNFADQIQK